MRLVHVTDLHTDLKKYERAVNYVNSSGADGLIITGDLTDRNSVTYPQAYKEAVMKAKVKNASPEVSDLMKQHDFLVGKNVEMKKKGATDEDLEDLIGEFQILESKIEKALEPIRGEIDKSALQLFRNYQVSEAQEVDEILGGAKSTVLAVLGNHDPYFLPEVMENIHFLDRAGSVELSGLRFAGTPSTYEMVRGIPMNDYTHLGDYVVDGQVSESPEYNRLKGQKIDVLATHTTLLDRLTKDTMRGKKPDQVMLRILQESGAKLNLGGHFHEPSQGRVSDILNLNPGDGQIYDMEIEKVNGAARVKKLIIYGFE
ncbi:MAG: metallophosphoesterase [Candidatus Nanoarchaeia archaeon]|nr:metallophosphoesterase [Candidatus Nanoarchaeia archaeon]